jgi:rubrerythrin
MGTAGKLNAALTDLLYQALQTEQGGIKVYEQAITCAINDDLKEEWTKYLEETRRHEQVVLSLFASSGLDPDLMTPGREVVAGIGDALVATIKKAKAKGTREQAQIVASECVVLAETKDHANWELLAHVAEKGSAAQKAFLKEAVEEVEKEEDHHLFHTKGWMRELWIQELGFPAVLPPPEEVRQVETAIGASRAEQDREKYM